MVTGWFAGVVVLILYTLAVFVWMVLVLVPMALQLVQHWIWGSDWQRKVGWGAVTAVFFCGSVYLVYEVAPSYFATVTPIDDQYFFFGALSALFVGYIVFRWRMVKLLGVEPEPWDD